MLRRSVQKVGVVSRSNSSNNLGGGDQLMEKLMSEYQILASRPLPPMASRQHQSNLHQLFSPTSSNNSQYRTSREEPTYTEWKTRAEKAESDLLIAAKFGHSLLEQNKELQEKNEFLEESLCTSKDTIAQLDKKLKQRCDLFQKLSTQIECLDGEQQGDEERQFSSRMNNSERLRLKVKQLEGENEKLRIKNIKMETQLEQGDERDEQKINEYVSQLRIVKTQVAHLQAQLGEKSRQCEMQAEEIQKLLGEIAQRKNREKLLWEENEDLHVRLDDALTSHAQLSHDIRDIQERHFELIAMLRETEDELKVYRENAFAVVPPRRSNSMDSLYDSLASELEGADSGCYNTPNYSTRNRPSPRESSLINGMGNQPCCSSSIDQLEKNLDVENSIAQRELTNEDVFKSQPIDIPSRALLDVIRNTFDDRRQFQQKSPQRGLLHEMNEDGPFGQRTPLAPSQTLMNGGDNQKNDVLELGEIPLDSDSNIKREASTELEKTPQSKTFRDASCSPIHFLDQSVLHKLGKRQDNVVIVEKVNHNEGENGHRSIFKFASPSRRTDNTTSPSTASIDSLDGYSPPKLGVPGRPGTRDLDLRVRRLGLRKEIDERYKRFQASRGHIPTNFYSQPIICGPLFSFSDYMRQQLRRHECSIRSPSLMNLEKFAKKERSFDISSLVLSPRHNSRDEEISESGVYNRSDVL